ncbi:MAG TPA: hypothetical protein PLC99_07605 [Verrucomicrobiota bacterium]|nr:hypothetical protein [Verrucomicrobiota bacterium]
MSMEPSGVLDDVGAEAWFVALSISNRSGEALHFAREWATVEANVAGCWAEAKNQCQFDHLRPCEEREVVLLLPSGADAFRLRFNYLPEPLNLRFMRVCERLGLWRHPWGRALAARVLPVGWLQPLRSDIVGRSPRWREIQAELPLPRAPAGAPHAHDRVRRPD